MNAQDAILSALRLINKLSLVAAVAYCGWLGYDYYYDFQNNPESPKLQKQAQIQEIQTQNQGLKKRIAEINAFFKNLEAKKQELRGLAQELDSMKSTLSDSIDVPSFMNLITTEARKVGMTVSRIRPAENLKKEYYGEQHFDLEFRGVYVQLLVFLNRLSQSAKIIRVDSYKLKPRSSSRARFVELEGTLQIKAFYYLGTKEDKLGREG
jgi:Tfp pilus assembly protein PilO